MRRQYNSARQRKRRSWRTAAMIFGLAVVLAVTATTITLAVMKDSRAQAAANSAESSLPAAGVDSQTSQAPEHLVVALGDSFTAGSDEGGNDDLGWPAIVEDDLNQDGVPTRVVVAAVGGVGYARKDADGVDFTRIADRVAHSDSLKDTQLVIVTGSRNDMTYPPSYVEENATRTYAILRSGLPNARLLVIGPAWQSETPPEQMLEVRDAVARAANSAGAEFIDPIGALWFTARNQQTLIGADGVHPTDAGHQMMAALILPRVEDILRQDAP